MVLGSSVEGGVFLTSFVSHSLTYPLLDHNHTVTEHQRQRQAKQSKAVEMNTLTKLLFTMVYCGWMVPTSVAFVIPTQGNSVARIQDTSLGMSADIDETALGATERLLIARNSVTVDDGRRQEFGCTVKNDSLDGLRAVVWTMFNVSQVVFPILGLLLVGETMLSMAGYGCYWDAQGYFVLDTLEHIQREEVLSAEVARLAENPFWK